MALMIDNTMTHPKNKTNVLRLIRRNDKLIRRYAGIDIGSRTVELVVVDEAGQILGSPQDIAMGLH